MRELEVLTPEEQEEVRNLDKALIILDRFYYSIQSKIRRLITQVREKDPKTAEALHELRLRLQGLYEQMMEAEMAIIESIVDYYRAFHGPHREQPSLTVGFANTNLGRRSSSRITSLFHTYTVEYGSILDATIGVVIAIGGKSLPAKIRNSNTYGKFIKLAKKDPQLRSALNEMPLFVPWLKYEGLLTSIKNRRDQLIHHQYVPLLSLTNANAEHVELEFWSPEVNRSARDRFDINRGIILKYNHFCRGALYALFKLLIANLSELQELIRTRNDGVGQS